MKDFRGPLPLTDADFAAIRANVLAQVRPRRRVFVWRLAFAAVIAAFVILLSRTPATPPASVERRPLRPPAPMTASQNPRPTAEAAVAPPSAPRIHVVRKRRAPEPETPQFRMEIQTSDPDIRIIWLPNQNPKSNTLEDQS